MFDVEIHHIRFTLRADSPVHMGAQAGGQIRGALWQALSNSVCTSPAERHLSRHMQHCPMCFLLELQKNSPRGNTPPRPFIIRPPLAVRAEQDRKFKAGEMFEIGLILVGRAGQLLPYLVQGMQSIGQIGVGYGRGHFLIKAIEAYHPLTTQRQSLLEDGIVQMPQVRLTGEDIVQAVQSYPTDTVKLRFITPTTLKHKGKILEHPDFLPLIGRLLERCQAMAFHYGDTSAESDLWQPQYVELTQLAQSIEPVLDNTRWVEVRSGSRRSNRYHDVGGFVGEVHFIGDLKPFIPWLLWGQSLQVGKHIVKGNGWYEIP